MNMNLLRKICLVGLVSTVSGWMASPAIAQGDPTLPQQTQTNPTQANQADPAIGAAMDTFSGIYQAPWFSEPSIRQQLQMNDAQYNQLNQAYVTNWNRYSERTNQIANDRTLSSQQRQDRLDQLNGSFYNSFSNSANNVLNDAAVRQRYNQMYYQYRGYGAFNDPTVQKQLNLSDAQRQSVRTAERNWNRKMWQYNRDYAADPDAVLKRYNEARPEFQEHLRTILTPSQQQQWSEMTGSRFDIPANVYFDNGVTTTTTAKPPLK